MNQLLNIFLIAVFFAVATSCEQGTSEKQTKDAAEDVNDETLSGAAEEDAEFMIEAYSYSLMLQEYGELAKEKEGLPKTVQEFAEKSVDFNKDLKEGLEKLAKDTQVVLPVAVGENVVKYKEELSEKEGTEFAEEYMDTVEDIQDKMASKYQEVLESTQNSQLNEWIQSVLPQVKKSEKKGDVMEDHADELN